MARGDATRPRRRRRHGHLPSGVYPVLLLAGEGCDSLDQYFPFPALSTVKYSDIIIFLSSGELPMKRVAEAFSNVHKAQYDIKLNNAILAEEKHLPMYDELASKGNVDYGVYCWMSATHNSIS